jgi:hypothetical protein
MTRILLVPIFLVPLLWVWPQRGITVAFYTNSHWSNEPALVRVERQINPFASRLMLGGHVAKHTTSTVPERFGNSNRCGCVWVAASCRAMR